MGQPKSNNLTPRDLEIAAAAWKCFKTEPSIDYAKLAEVAGFKNAASASACWNTTKKKLFASSTASNDIASPGTPKTPASRKRKATPAKKSTGEDVFEGTPSKKGKKNIEIEDDEVIDNTDVKNEVKEEEEEIEEFLDTDRKDSFFDARVTRLDNESGPSTPSKASRRPTNRSHRERPPRKADSGFFSIN